jgi:hypothetical protein
LNAVARTAKVPLSKNKGFLFGLFFLLASSEQRKEKKKIDYMLFHGADICFKPQE